MILAPGLFNVTCSAKSLEAVRIIRVLAGLPLHWRDVIALKTTGTATQNAPIAITLEDMATDSGPAALVDVDVVPAHGIINRELRVVQLEVLLST